MPDVLSRSSQHFQNDVAIKFQLYNSLFLSLPFHKIEKTGILLSLLLTQCEDGYSDGKTPDQILNEFFSVHTILDSPTQKLDLLFRFVQYIERQIVLFDALEDSGYSKINDIKGAGTLKQLESNLLNIKLSENEIKKLNNFCVRLVLTAHPTQFYPGSVLGIINDLAVALGTNDTESVNLLLQQLGKTPFLNKQKPTPYDEAVSLIWFLENIFYNSISEIITEYKDSLTFLDPSKNPVIRMGFWPGGDRDGNPFVNADTTYRVATSLNIALLKCYYRDMRRLKRRLTFNGVDQIIAGLESRLYEQAFLRSNFTINSTEDLLIPLQEVKQVLESQHNGLFTSMVDKLISKVYCFGLHFAFIDIRQENDVHTAVIDQYLTLNEAVESYNALSEAEKIDYLISCKGIANPDSFESELFKDTIRTISTVKKIQQEYGEAACHRYIISQCNTSLNVIEVLALFGLAGWDKNRIDVDVVPLFETVDDLVRAPEIMKRLYELPYYRAHLKRRNHRQTIMLGFSDGTKDGGYLMANWMIYKAKEELSKQALEYGLDVLFFDGRGGPPARGGGKTHKFYASMDKDISSKEIQLTIQGQTVSSNFGIIDSARFNIEQLINAGITNNLQKDTKSNFTDLEEALIFKMAEISLKSYLSLKNHSNFVDYMTEVSPLKYFGQTNIGSRPAKRGKTEKLTIKDLRAIPFVASWNMIKQNVPGFFGLGTALEQMKEEGKFEDIKALYKKSLFFRTLVDNSEMTLFKTFLPLTSHVSHHPKHGIIWNIIKDEYELTKTNLLLLGGHNLLMQEYPVERLSVGLRERITLPLNTIQQYALNQLMDMNDDDPLKPTYIKIVVRCAFGIINAGRNSA
ncbi:MAG: phosphoenolpyruvate carboxylase [Saprospiraceae bacterium]|nr:phosphoenolpyruvate carboxylase [Saprospiraceae bacterium]